MKSVAVLGGTFDPVHLAHLELAHTLVNTFNFEKVLFIPCKQNLLKEHSPATAQERIEMIQLAISPFRQYQCDTREIDRDTPSYTIETLKALRAAYPEDSLTFTMGVDSLNSLEQWHYFEDFLHYVHLFIFPRPGHVLEPHSSVKTLMNQAKTTDIQDLHTNKHGYIYFSEHPKNPISSTGIRAFLKNKTSTHLLDYLPQSVLNYIKSKSLYK
jgi:nicotinate-nucleotide adenylyltransferase